MGYTQSGISRNCPICDDKYITYSDGSYGAFCWDCRKVFQVENDTHADRLLELIRCSPDKLPGMKEESMRKRSRRGEIVHTPRPQVDREKVAEAVRSLVEYGRLAHDPAPLTMPTTYIIAKNGLFEVRSTDLATVTIPAKEPMGLTRELKPGIQLNIPKAPYDLLSQTVAFFREVCVKQKGSSEALVQIWYDTRSRQHVIHVPEQDVSGGSVHHRSSFDREGERAADGTAVWLHMMDIHSHGSSMSAFWSSTDDGDERKAPEGRMFGVIGKVNQPMPEWRWRMRTREGFIDLNVADLFELDLAEKVGFTVTWDVIMRVAAEKDGISSAGYVKLDCPVDPFKDATCPAEWHQQVKSGWGGQTGMGFIGTGAGGRRFEPLPSYLYVRSEDGATLREMRIEPGQVPVATGKVIPLGRR